jgi:hypothetical protein
MAFSSVTKQGIDGSKHTFATNKNVFIPEKTKNLLLKADVTYKFRIVPNNSDVEKYGKEFNSFAIAQPQHYGIGQNKKEYVPCPQQIAPKLKIQCPLCAEFAELGTKSDRACSKVYYYMRVVLMNKIEGIPNYKEDGKTFIVYTIKVPKKSVIDALFDYYDDTDRAVPDMADLADGCSITIKVSKQTIEARNGKTITVPNYNTQINEASKGSLVKVIDPKDVTDLRDINAWVPTAKAIREAMEGLPLSEAIGTFGKVSTIDGKQVGGVAEEPTDLPDDTGIEGEEVEIVEE